MPTAARTLSSPDPGDHSADDPGPWHDPVRGRIQVADAALLVRCDPAMPSVLKRLLESYSARLLFVATPRRREPSRV